MTPDPGQPRSVRRAACLWVSVTAAVLGGCGAEPVHGPHLTVDWHAAPTAAAAAADSLAELRLTDDHMQPIVGARIQVDAFMTHPGMAPVTAAVQEQGRGIYRARLRFSMAGDWVLRVHGTLPDGRSFELRNDVRDVRPAE